jgi:hypothetical protein
VRYTPKASQLHPQKSSHLPVRNQLIIKPYLLSPTSCKPYLSRAPPCAPTRGILRATRPVYPSPSQKIRRIHRSFQLLLTGRPDVTTAPSLSWHRPRWLVEGLTSFLRFRAVRIIPLIHILKGSTRDCTTQDRPATAWLRPKPMIAQKNPKGKIRSVGGTYGSLGNHLS